MGEVFKLNHCYNVDCVPAMELFPDDCFDLAVVDPPYFSGPERRGFYGSKVSKIEKNYALYQQHCFSRSACTPRCNRCKARTGHR